MQRAIAKIHGKLQPVVRLSRKEAIILRMLCTGLTLKEIAFRAGLADSTLRWYLSVLRAGLRLSDRTDLRQWAIQHPSAFRGRWTEASLHPMGCSCPSSYCRAVRIAWSEIIAAA